MAQALRVKAPVAVGGGDGLVSGSRPVVGKVADAVAQCEAEQRELSTGSHVPHQLKTPSVAAVVAAQLRLRILDGDLVDGSELPTEAVLLKQFPVSRPSLREAFRILETEGLLVVRRGKRGGTTITHPTADTAAYHLGLLLHSKHTTVKDLAAARNLLEPLCVELAASRRDHVSLGRPLARSCKLDEAALGDGVAFTGEAIKFHHQLVEASGNVTLQVLAGVLESVWDVQELSWARSAVSGGDYPSMSMRREVVRAHLRLCAAIEAGDVPSAVRQTRAHLKAASTFVTAAGVAVRVIDGYGGRRRRFDG